MYGAQNSLDRWLRVFVQRPNWIWAFSLSHSTDLIVCDARFLLSSAPNRSKAPKHLDDLESCFSLFCGFTCHVTDQHQHRIDGPLDRAKKYAFLSRWMQIFAAVSVCFFRSSFAVRVQFNQLRNKNTCSICVDGRCHDKLHALSALVVCVCDVRVSFRKNSEFRTNSNSAFALQFTVLGLRWLGYCEWLRQSKTKKNVSKPKIKSLQLAAAANANECATIKSSWFLRSTAEWVCVCIWLAQHQTDVALRATEARKRGKMLT